MPGPWKLLPCPSCCECVFFTENWDRAAGTDLGPDWTEIHTASGDWFLVFDNGYVVETTSVGAAAVSTQTPPISGGTFNVIIQANIHKTTVLGNAYKLITNYIDENNYHFALLSYTEDNGCYWSGTLALWERAAGSEILLRSTVITTDFSVGFEAPCDIFWWLCLSPSGLVTSVGPSYEGGPSWCGTQPVAGTWATATPVSSVTGFGAGKVDPSDVIQFGQIVLTKHTVDDATCNPCVTCGACAGPPPEEFEVVIADLTGVGADPCYDCGNLNGTYFLAFDDELSISASACVEGLHVGFEVCVWRFLFSGDCEAAEIRLTMTVSQFGHILQLFIFKAPPLIPGTTVAATTGLSLGTTGPNVDCSEINEELQFAGGFFGGPCGQGTATISEAGAS